MARFFQHTDCAANYSIDNGVVHFTGRNTTVNHTVPITCDTGYKIKGDIHITCMEDGTWSNRTSCVTGKLLSAPCKLKFEHNTVK